MAKAPASRWGGRTRVVKKANTPQTRATATAKGRTEAQPGRQAHPVEPGEELHHHAGAGHPSARPVMKDTPMARSMSLPVMSGRCRWILNMPSSISRRLPTRGVRVQASTSTFRVPAVRG